MRLNQKITIGAVLLAAAPVLLASLIIQSVATDSSHQALEQAAMERLLALRDAKKTQIEDYYRNIHNQLLNLSKSTTAIEALDSFRDAVASPIFEEEEKTGESLSLIAETIRQINEISQQNAVGAQQAATAGIDLSRLSSELQSLVKQFKV